MKKIFFVSLILVSAFLIGSSGVAWAPCMNYQQYQCTGTAYQYGEVDETYGTCVGLCLDYLSYADYDYLWGEWFNCYLYPATDNKHLLGTADTMYEWAGCSVELRGRSLTAKLSYIEEDEGYIDVIKCTPCNDCCI
jgi:hypothetical protein